MDEWSRGEREAHSIALFSLGFGQSLFGISRKRGIKRLDMLIFSFGKIYSNVQSHSSNRSGFNLPTDFNFANSTSHRFSLLALCIKGVPSSFQHSASSPPPVPRSMLSAMARRKSSNKTFPSPLVSRNVKTSFPWASPSKMLSKSASVR